MPRSRAIIARVRSPSHVRAVPVGLLRSDLPSAGPAARRRVSATDERNEVVLLRDIAERFRTGRERKFPLEPKIAGARLHLALDRHLDRWRKGAGAAVFELLGRVLANEKAAPGLAQSLGAGSPALPIVLLDRSRSLVALSPDGDVLGVSRAVLTRSGLGPTACLVAASIAHGLRAAVRIREGEPYDPAKETDRDVQNLLLLLVGVLGTEWDPEKVHAELRTVLTPEDPILDPFLRYAKKLRGTLAARHSSHLDDRVFRDGAVFDRLSGREKWKVILAGTLAWYGLLTLGLLRLPRRFIARRNPYYETAWWIFRAKPGGRRLFKESLLRRSGRALRGFRLLAAFEYLWASWNPVLAETCLRPVYRAAGGNRRPFLATIATYAWTALVIHPLWVTLSITGLAWAAGTFWPWIHEHTRIASRENLILHAIVIGFWMGVGLLVALSKRKNRTAGAASSVVRATGAGPPRRGSSR